MPRTAEREELLERALGQPWYHTIELAPGRATEGAVDLRRVAPRVLPDDLGGARALDVGAFDGFWAFELERRGAEEVFAVDLESHEDTDWAPLHRERLARAARAEGKAPHARFELAARVLDSGVERIASSVYDLDREQLGGAVDFALVGALLLHLRDPVGALERVRSLLSEEGRIVLVEPIVLSLTLLRPRRALASLRAISTDYDWWVPNAACLRDWLRLAGFSDPRRLTMFRLKAVRPIRQWHMALEARR